MMFILRNDGRPPEIAGVAVKLSRATPQVGTRSTTDFFCVGEAGAMAALREAGWSVVELHDGFYEDGHGGGVAIWGQGRYWEIREEPLAVREAVGSSAPAEAGVKEGEHVEVRRAIFGA